MPKPQEKRKATELADVVLDASAVLAVLNGEPGADEVGAHLPALHNCCVDDSACVQGLGYETGALRTRSEATMLKSKLFRHTWLTRAESECMVERSSALGGQAIRGRFGNLDSSGVTLEELAGLQLHQVAAWPDTLETVGKLTATAMALDEFSMPGQASGNHECAILRIEPLKWWLLGTTPPKLDAGLGATLDLSHSRTRLRISGVDTLPLLNRVLPLDLREQQFPVGKVASSAVHHVGVTLWRNELGYELLIPRGYAISVWEILLESALQFGAEVV